MHSSAFLFSKVLSAVPTSKTSTQIASECTIRLPCFQKFLHSYKLPKHLFKQRQQHPLASLFSKQFQLRNPGFKLRQFSHLKASLLSIFSQQFQHPKRRFKFRQNAPLCVLAFRSFSANPASKTSFQQRQNAPFSVRDFKISAVPTFCEKYITAGETSEHFPTSRKLQFAHATPLVTDFPRMQPRRLKLPNILDSDDKC